MKIAVATRAYWRYTLEQSINRIARNGFKAVEITAHRPHCHPDDYSREKRQEIVKLVRSLNLEICAVSTAVYPDFGLDHPSSSVREYTIGFLKKGIDLCADLKAPICQVVAGLMSPYAVSEDAWAVVRSGLQECVAYASSRKILIALECEPLSIISTVQDTIRMIDEIHSPFLKALVDIGHLNVTKENVRDAIKALGKNLVHVHLDDNDGAADQHLPPGNGTIDFETFFDSLREVKYAGFVSIELESPANPDSDLNRSKLFLKRYVRD